MTDRTNSPNDLDAASGVAATERAESAGGSASESSNGATDPAGSASSAGPNGDAGVDEDEPQGDAAEYDDGEDDEDAEDDGEVDEEPGEAELFRQSEIAADYIEGLLDILDYDGDIDELVQGGRPVVEVVGGRLNKLVGNRGATLEALQELTRLAVYRQTGEPSRLMLDVGGFRATRRKELAAVAKNAAERVKQLGESVRLEPMTAFERKCVHDVINAMPGVQSESEGVEPNRRVVVRPAD
ncbi:MAG TPA: R3H domain-containing nucleic acid-binding protein [Micromonosporaceae bacterium]|nr:R3H domain-containing nucleic acid-binding protein [Micromonosporaceae bacterium]